MSGDGPPSDVGAAQERGDVALWVAEAYEAGWRQMDHW